MIKGCSRKGGKYAWTDVSFQQNDRECKKMSNGNNRCEKHEMKNAFDLLISRLDTAKERIMNLKMDH